MSENLRDSRDRTLHEVPLMVMPSPMLDADEISWLRRALAEPVGGDVSPPSAGGQDAGNRLFVCDRYPGKLRITPNYCKLVWPKAQRARQWQRLYPCRGCPIGAQHVAGAQTFRSGRPAPDSICTRCHARGRRMVLAGRICVSCFNREREYLLGANAKGTPPTKHPSLFDCALRVCGNQGMRQLRIDRVASRLEAMLRVCLPAQSPIMLARPLPLASVEDAACTVS